MKAFQGAGHDGSFGEALILVPVPDGVVSRTLLGGMATRRFQASWLSSDRLMSKLGFSACWWFSMSLR